MGIYYGSQTWESIEGANPGSQVWESIMGAKSKSQVLEPIIGVNYGIQSILWKSLLKVDCRSQTKGSQLFWEPAFGANHKN